MTQIARLGLGAGVFALAAGLAASTIHACIDPTKSADPVATSGPDLLPANLESALRRYCALSDDPAAKRAEMIEKLVVGNRCYSRQMSADQWQHALEDLDLLPPGLYNEPGGPRYFSSSTVWTGNGNVAGVSGRAQSVNLTVSFPNDGVAWDGANNVLDARVGSLFGATNKDRGREFIRQGLANWQINSGIRYTEVADDNVGFTTTTVHSALRGDIRIGARSVDGTFGILAYNNFPASGGDMVLDADEFIGGSFAGATNNYRAYRNTVAHEHGHGTGFIHTVPCNSTKLMEPQLATSFEMLEIDDIRGAQRNYGDRFAGNNSAANATNFGDLTSPVLKSIIERNLSTNGAAGFNNSDEDWFRFTIGSAQNVVISVDPTGGSYVNGQQSSGCTGSTSTINADQAGNLNVELRDSAGTTVLMSSVSGGLGVTETINAAGLAAGTYTVRVFDVGPNSNQIVQLYDLTLRVGTAKAPPTACAGIDKRVLAGTTCWFMANVNSYNNEASGSSITQYSWDLDGDGTFEVANSATPTRTYSANGVVNVTLRITDNFGMQATDTIQVVVFGATCPVTIDSQPVSLTRCTGQSATFSVSASSGGSLTYQWRRNSVNLAGQTNPSITINPVVAGSAGNYDCVVTASCGGVVNSNIAVLTVNEAVAITTQPVSQTAMPGDNVIFGVAATGGGTINYQWFKNNSPIPGANSTALLLLGVTTADSGTYRCDVTNTCGTVMSNNATLMVASPCACDWNNDGTLSSQDFFDFIAGFFTNAGDFNGDGTTTSQDFFDFLACFFSGC
ncbi:MAG: immunoglobulin domain-containing protein [Phycisphaerales bacterium]